MENGFFACMSDTLSSDWIALMLRLTIGISLLPYAIAKISEAANPPAHFPKVPMLSPKAAFYLAMVLETTASVGCILGFCTRIAAFIGIGVMAVATLKVHGKYWNATAMPYFLGFIAILLAGAGKYSLDYLFR